MAGGIFGHQAFVLNPKCVAFSFLVILLFFYRPPVDMTRIGIVVTIAALFVASYVSMAWYDYYFECRIDPLQKSQSPLSVTEKLKPPVHSLQQISPVECSKQKTLIYMFHIIIVAPLLAWIAYRKHTLSSEWYTIIGAMSLLAFAYHGSKLLYS